MNPLRMKSWSPYLVGAGIGLLSWLTFATVDKPIGITTACEYSAALTEKAAVPQVTEPYLEAKAKEADFGEVTLPHFTGTLTWLWAGGLALVLAITLAILERVHPRRFDSTP